MTVVLFGSLALVVAVALAPSLGLGLIEQTPEGTKVNMLGLVSAGLIVLLGFLVCHRFVASDGRGWLVVEPHFRHDGGNAAANLSHLRFPSAKTSKEAFPHGTNCRGRRVHRLVQRRHDVAGPQDRLPHRRHTQQTTVGHSRRSADLGTGNRLHASQAQRRRHGLQQKEGVCPRVHSCHPMFSAFWPKSRRAGRAVRRRSTRTTTHIFHVSEAGSVAFREKKPEPPTRKYLADDLGRLVSLLRRPGYQRQRLTKTDDGHTRQGACKYRRRPKTQLMEKIIERHLQPAASLGTRAAGCVDRRHAGAVRRAVVAVCGRRLSVRNRRLRFSSADRCDTCPTTARLNVAVDARSRSPNPK